MGLAAGVRAIGRGGQRARGVRRESGAGAEREKRGAIPIKKRLIRFISAAKLQKILHICKFFRTFAPDFNLDEYA